MSTKSLAGMSDTRSDTNTNTNTNTNKKKCAQTDVVTTIATIVISVIVGFVITWIALFLFVVFGMATHNMSTTQSMLLSIGIASLFVTIAIFLIYNYVSKLAGKTILLTVVILFLIGTISVNFRGVKVV